MTEQNSKRYEWLKKQKNLVLSTEGVKWFYEDGSTYYPSHRLDVNGTGFHGVEHLDDLIDMAMKVYP